MWNFVAVGCLEEGRVLELNSSREGPMNMCQIVQFTGESC